MLTHQSGFGPSSKSFANSRALTGVAAVLILGACATPESRSSAGAASVQAAAAKTPPLPESWKPLTFLLGSWEAAGGGVPGASAGTFSFQPDVQGHVLVRRNASTTPGGRHEDLMVLYQVAPGSFRAIYFDNEDHVIQYAVTASDSPPSAVFVTDDTPGRPRFRLSYAINPDSTLTTRFEIAPPGADFRTYLEGTARRSSPIP
jgi:hypothetical protein